MDKSSCSISVIIPAYNAAKHIGRAIQSILNQTSPVDEIIVIDDGSTDDTTEVVRSFGDKVKLIKQPNSGASAARNTGINAAKGDWIAFLDADDEWLPQKFELQKSLLNRNPDLVWATGNYQECLCSENRVAEYTPARKCIGYLNGLDYYPSYLNAVQKYQMGHTNCFLIKKQVLLQAGLFCTDLPIAEDIDLWLRIAYRYPKVGFSPQPLAIHHLALSDSLMISSRPAHLYSKFIARHMQLAKEQSQLDNFTPAAGAIMRRWIRGMLFNSRKDEIRELLRLFPQAFSRPYRLLIFAATVFPSLTENSLRLISKIVRKLKLRRRLTRPPKKN